LSKLERTEISFKELQSLILRLSKLGKPERAEISTRELHLVILRFVIVTSSKDDKSLNDRYPEPVISKVLRLVSFVSASKFSSDGQLLNSKFSKLVNPSRKLSS
jgi:hypothetical protein